MKIDNRKYAGFISVLVTKLWRALGMSKLPSRLHISHTEYKGRNSKYSFWTKLDKNH